MSISEISILPPDVRAKVDQLTPLDGESQGRAVTALLSHSRTGLLTAIAAQDLPQIVEWKARGAAIQEIAKQLQLGKDMQQDAAEFVRRAERGLGVAIRDGQENGKIATKSSAARDRRRREHGDIICVLPNVKDIAPDFYANTHTGSSIADFTDGISDEAFEEALAEARAEDNLSRANVARKSKAKTKSKPSTEKPKPKVPRRAYAHEIQSLSWDLAKDSERMTDEELNKTLGAAQFLTNLLQGEQIIRKRAKNGN